MKNSWKLAVPAALALMVAGCATSPAPMPMPPPAPVAAAPVVPPSASVAVPDTQVEPVRTTRRYRNARTRPAPGAPGTDQTTAGPTAVGRTPAAAQPVGNGGS